MINARNLVATSLGSNPVNEDMQSEYDEVVPATSGSFDHELHGAVNVERLAPTVAPPAMAEDGLVSVATHALIAAQ